MGRRLGNMKQGLGDMRGDMRRRLGSIGRRLGNMKQGLGDMKQGLGDMRGDMRRRTRWHGKETRCMALEGD